MKRIFTVILAASGLPATQSIMAQDSIQYRALTGLMSMLGMNIICATTANPTLVVLSCFLLGFTKVFALVEVYVIWMFVWTKQADSTRFYPFVYFIALSGLYLVTWWTTRLAYNYNWHYAYILPLHFPVRFHRWHPPV